MEEKQKKVKEIIEELKEKHFSLSHEFEEKDSHTPVMLAKNLEGDIVIDPVLPIKEEKKPRIE
ncbi:MAG TPA: hypothetical protein VJK05_05720 [archaeon]|nr:hypothetical protein [archaeon]